MTIKKKILLLIYGILFLPIALLIVLVIASQWSASHFSGIHNGSTMHEVQNIVGLPDSITTNEAEGYIVWHYKDPWPWKSQTVVCFDTNGAYKVYHP